MIGNVGVIAIIPSPAFSGQIPPALHVAPEPGLLGLEGQDPLGGREPRMPEIAPESDVVQHVVVIERHRVAEVVGFGQPVGQHREGTDAGSGVGHSKVDA